MPSCYIRFWKDFLEKRSGLQLHVGWLCLVSCLLPAWMGEGGRIIVSILLHCTDMVCFPCLWDVQGRTFRHTEPPCSTHLYAIDVCMVLSTSEIRSLRVCFRHGRSESRHEWAAVLTCTSQQVRDLGAASSRPTGGAWKQNNCMPSVKSSQEEKGLSWRADEQMYRAQVLCLRNVTRL